MKPPVANTLKHCCGLLCSLVLVSLPGAALAADKDRQLKQLQGEIKTLSQQVTKTRAERDDERKKLRDIEKRIATLHKQQRATHKQQKSLQQQLTKLQQQQAASHQRLRQLRELLEQITQLRHRQGEQGQLKLLLNQQLDKQHTDMVLKEIEYKAAVLERGALKRGKISQADFVIENNGTSFLIEQLIEIDKKLKEK